MQQMIDELEALMRTAARMPLGGKLLIDEAALRHVIEGLRAGLPDEVRMGQRIGGERDRILAEARAQARRIIEEAQAQNRTHLDDQAVVQTARQRAREIQQEAERAAAKLRTEADQYVLQQLHSLENRLQHVLRELQGGQRALKQDG